MKWVIPADPGNPEDHPLTVSCWGEGDVGISLDGADLLVPYDEVPVLITFLAVAADHERRAIIDQEVEDEG